MAKWRRCAIVGVAVENGGHAVAPERLFEQGDVVFRESRSIFFKKMQIVRGCDVKRNVLDAFRTPAGSYQPGQWSNAAA